MDSLMKETILTKTAVYKESLARPHLFQTFETFINSNKEKFTDESWDCHAITSLNLTRNILELGEFKYMKDYLISLLKVLYKDQEFIISDSWINILTHKGFQEFHNHPAHPWVGVLYLTNNNSDIEFVNFYPKEVKMKIKPKKYDILIFEGSTYHRVLPQEMDIERLSLAFNTVKR